MFTDQGKAFQQRLRDVTVYMYTNSIPPVSDPDGLKIGNINNKLALQFLNSNATTNRRCSQI